MHEPVRPIRTLRRKRAAFLAITWHLPLGPPATTGVPLLLAGWTDEQSSLPAGLMLVTTLMLAFLAVMVWRQRNAPNDRYLILVLAATAVWAAGDVLELLDVAGAAPVWGNLKYVGVCALPPSWVGFVLAYTGRRHWFTPTIRVALLVEPLAVLALLANPSTTSLIRYYPHQPLPQVPVADTGPLFWLHFTYTSVVLWAATALLLASLSRVPHVHVRRMRLVGLSLVVPWLLTAAYSAGIPGPLGRFELTPFALLGSELVLLRAVGRLPSAEVLGVSRSHVFDTVTSPVVVLDVQHRVVDANHAAEPLLAAPLRDVVGLPVAVAAPDLATALDSSRVTVGHRGEVELGGTVYDVTVSAATDRHGRRSGVLLAAFDVTERTVAEREHERRSLHDALTGLPHRELLLRRLRHLARSRVGVPPALLFVDVDDFKSVNDSLGHRTGDAVLVEVAARLRRSVREADLVVRFGGDEFAVLLEDTADDSEVVAVAEHVVAAFQRPVTALGRHVLVHVSVGVSLARLDDDPERLIDLADAAMYAAKSRGRNRVEVGCSCRPSAARRCPLTRPGRHPAPPGRSSAAPATGRRRLW